MLKEKGKSLFNIILCVVFIKIGIFFLTIKSPKKLFDFPLYPTIGVLVILVHLVLMVKWINKLYTQKKL